MTRRIIFALLLTLALAFAARKLSEREPMNLYIEDRDVKVWHRTVTEVIVRTADGREIKRQPYIEIKLDGPSHLRKTVDFKSRKKPQVEKRRLIPIGENKYSAYLPYLEIGEKIWYAIVLIRDDGSVIRIPRGNEFFEVRSKGEASQGILIAHAVSMFAAFFFMILSFFGAVRILRQGDEKSHTVTMSRLALIFAFLGTVPLGFALNKQTFGILWEGYPFGYDITDNKTQIVILFWLFSLLLVRGSSFWGGEEKDLLGKRVFAWAIIASFVASIALYLIPHSL